MTASRCELANIQMQVSGNFPQDLQGHVFTVTPVGSEVLILEVFHMPTEILCCVAMA